MTSCINKVILVGALGRDPEVRQLRDNATVVNLSVGTTESWFDKKANEQRERTEWHRVVVFNEHVARFAQTLTKGAKVYVEGQLQSRKWTDQATGQEKTQTEIVIARGRGELAWVDQPGGPGSSPEGEDSFGGGRSGGFGGGGGGRPGGFGGGGERSGGYGGGGDRGGFGGGGDRSSSYAPRGDRPRYGAGDRFGGGAAPTGGDPFSTDRSEKSGGRFSRGGPKDRDRKRDFDDD